MYTGVLELSTKGDIELFLRYTLFLKCFLNLKYAVISLKGKRYVPKF